MPGLRKVKHENTKELGYQKGDQDLSRREVGCVYNQKIKIMDLNLFAQTMKGVEGGANIQELAGNLRKEINHHVFRGLTLMPQELTNMFNNLRQRYQRTTRRSPTLNWLQEEKKLYQCFLLTYCHLHFKKIIEISTSEWASFSLIFGDKNILLLKYEAKIIQKNQQRVRWSRYEQDLLNQCTRGSRELKWAEISRYIYFQSQGAYFKTPKQCRQHWNNHMNKDITHGVWSIDEDLIILSLVVEQGRKWAKIALQLKNKRTEHMIKNRFHSLLTCAKHLLKHRHELKRDENQLVSFFKKILESKQKKLQQEHKNSQIKEEDRALQYISLTQRQQNIIVNYQSQHPQNITIKAEEPDPCSDHDSIEDESQEIGPGLVKVEEIKSRQEEEPVPQITQRQPHIPQFLNYPYMEFKPFPMEYPMMTMPPMMYFPFPPYPYPHPLHRSH